MRHVDLTELQTFAAGLVALALGTALCRRLRFLERLDIPAPVVGGLVIALGISALRRFGHIEILFASRISEFLLLVFFTAVGLSAKLSALKAGGKPLIILCAVTVVMIVAQNLVGVLVGLAYGAHPFYGLLVGSISFVGGPGTAAAWAKQAQAVGLTAAPEVAVASATLAVIAGAIVAGPLTGWLVKRHHLRGATTASGAPWLEPSPAVHRAAPPVEAAMRTMLLMMVAILIGDTLNAWANTAGWVLPGFLTAMLAGVLITNLADASGANLDFGPIERNGEMALQAFLAMYLMSLKVWTIVPVIVPLTLNVSLQIVITTLLAFLVLFRLLGRDYNAALTAGGFIGFGLSSMAVGMATMDKLASRYGPAPKAFLLITLAGSFFVDMANALIVQAFLALPMFH